MPLDPVKELQRTIGHGGIELFDYAPRLIERILLDRLWTQREDKNGVFFKSFESFVTHLLWQGLETTIEDLLLICRKRLDVQTLIRKEIEPISSHGGSRQPIHPEWQDDNIILPHEQNENKKQGTSATYTLGRLKRDHPDIADRVVSGEISANAGAIEAGFRSKLSPFQKVVKLLPQLSETERAEIHEMTAPKMGFSSHPEVVPLRKHL